jgi:O-acetyl-ADP-ribose deacetylase (regulator of RNase III)
MIEFRTGDIFESKCQTIVNPVNCVGVMGGGLAKIFKEKYPEMFEEYKALCDSKELRPGKLHFYKADAPWDHSILNFPTKDNWRNPSELDYLRKGLAKFVETYDQLGITSIAFPALGSGLGGLDWNDVLHIMTKYLEDIEMPIEIYLPKVEIL